MVVGVFFGTPRLCLLSDGQNGSGETTTCDMTAGGLLGPNEGWNVAWFWREKRLEIMSITWLWPLGNPAWWPNCCAMPSASEASWNHLDAPLPIIWNESLSAIFLSMSNMQIEGLHLVKLYNILYILYTWNPNDPCFDWKRPCFGGLTFENRGHLGSNDGSRPDRVLYFHILEGPGYQGKCRSHIPPSTFASKVPKNGSWLVDGSWLVPRRVNETNSFLHHFLQLPKPETSILLSQKCISQQKNANLHTWVTFCWWPPKSCGNLWGVFP